MSRSTPFHLVDNSPWPLIGSMSGFSVVASLVVMMHSFSSSLLLFSVVFLAVLCVKWWGDVSRESAYLGFHTKAVQTNLLTGMVWFIVSEVCFFFGFFWTFFHSSLNSVVEMGTCWPPLGIQVLDPMGVPLLNTVVLLSSGVTVTWSHYSLLVGDGEGASLGLSYTVYLGIFFTLLQGMEYVMSGFNISDSVYGSIFFMATGFHGFHVLVGTLFLVVCLGRLMAGHFSSGRHIGYECSIWYWHFVDVVWLFLYVCVYWWGGV
uniref:Cytochrome c oxidase subunit 3 n=1 Tax=Ascidiella aspersa TaxID=201961 RepID=S0DF77_9ASCI|nr:cytochrome c oxidase subunit III [Ascidiella aspersa]CCO25809.1 cytochrome c oxidase subunit III [Ascidiella aspersa]